MERPQRPWDSTGTAVTVGEMVRDHDRRLDDLEHWRAELRGAMSLMRLVFGVSLISGILAALSLAKDLTQVLSP